jgi:hypothetical protein
VSHSHIIVCPDPTRQVADPQGGCGPASSSLLSEFPYLTSSTGVQRDVRHRTVHHIRTTPGPPVACRPHRRYHRQLRRLHAPAVTSTSPRALRGGRERCGNLSQCARSQVEDWLPGKRAVTQTWMNVSLGTEQSTQQWMTGYVATEQSGETMKDWLPGYRAAQTQQWKALLYLVSHSSSGDPTSR